MYSFFFIQLLSQWENAKQHGDDFHMQFWHFDWLRSYEHQPKDEKKMSKTNQNFMVRQVILW